MPSARPRLMARDHPRVRGEQAGAAVLKVKMWGSPPRARGAGGFPVADAGPAGITPACAGSRLPDLWF